MWKLKACPAIVVCCAWQTDLDGERKDLVGLCVRLHRLVQRNDVARTEFLMRRSGGVLLVARLITATPSQVAVVENAILVYVERLVCTPFACLARSRILTAAGSSVPRQRPAPPLCMPSAGAAP